MVRALQQNDLYRARTTSSNASQSSTFYSESEALSLIKGLLQVGVLDFILCL